MPPLPLNRPIRSRKMRSRRGNRRNRRNRRGRNCISKPRLPSRSIARSVAARRNRERSSLRNHVPDSRKKGAALHSLVNRSRTSRLLNRPAALKTNRRKTFRPAIGRQIHHSVHRTERLSRHRNSRRRVFRCCGARRLLRTPIRRSYRRRRSR
jgi:hypothetical protein